MEATHATSRNFLLPEIHLGDALVHSMRLRGNAGLEQGSPSSPNTFGATMVGAVLVSTSEMWCYKSCLVQGSHREGQDTPAWVWWLCGHWSRSTAVSGRTVGKGKQLVSPWIFQ